MAWIPIEERMPPEGLHVLMEVSGPCIDEHGCTLNYKYLVCQIMTGELELNPDAEV